MCSGYFYVNAQPCPATSAALCSRTRISFELTKYGNDVPSQQILAANCVCADPIVCVTCGLRTNSEQMYRLHTITTQQARCFGRTIYGDEVQSQVNTLSSGGRRCSKSTLRARRHKRRRCKQLLWPRSLRLLSLQAHRSLDTTRTLRRSKSSCSAV